MLLLGMRDLLEKRGSVFTLYFQQIDFSFFSSLKKEREIEQIDFRGDRLTKIA